MPCRPQQGYSLQQEDLVPPVPTAAVDRMYIRYGPHGRKRFAISKLCEIPVNEKGELISHGARLHEKGECLPCMFLLCKSGCRDGAFCTDCHYPNHKISRNRIRHLRKERGMQKRAMFDSGILRDSLVIHRTFIEVAAEVNKDVAIAGTPRRASSCPPTPRPNEIMSGAYLQDGGSN